VLIREYHDREWGVPAHDDRTHFEFLILEAAQAALSCTHGVAARRHQQANLEAVTTKTSDSFKRGSTRL
jgi:3-methyladenine DNA glycosylase Tag